MELLSSASIREQAIIKHNAYIAKDLWASRSEDATGDIELRCL